MFKRLRQLLKLLLLTAAALLAILWWRSGDATDVFVVNPDAVSPAVTAFVQRDAVNLEYNGLRYLLRGGWQGGQLTVNWQMHTRLDSTHRQAVEELAWHRFAWRRQLQWKCPLQDVTDSDGHPVMLTVTMPLKMISVPAWLVIALLAAWPAVAIVRMARRRTWQTALDPILVRPSTTLAWLAVAIAAMWLIGYAWHLEFNIGRTDDPNAPDVYHMLAAGRGTIAWAPISRDWQNSEASYDMQMFSQFEPRALGTLGFEQAGSAPDSFAVYIPFWLLFIPCAVVPIARLLLRRFSRKIQVGHCPACDYDLRFSIDRCPECGRPIIRDPPAARRPRWQQGLACFAGVSVLMFAGLALFAVWMQPSITSPTAWQVLAVNYSHALETLEIGPGHFRWMRNFNGPSPSVLLQCPAWLALAMMLAVSGGLLWFAMRWRPHVVQPTEISGPAS